MSAGWVPYSQLTNGSNPLEQRTFTSRSLLGMGCRTGLPINIT